MKQTKNLTKLYIALSALFLLSMALPITTFAGQSKTAVCHLDGDGHFHLIDIADPAVDKHIAHGDVLPGTNGLDENCVEVPPLSTGCQAANIPAFTYIIGPRFDLAPETFYAGETVTFQILTTPPAGTFITTALFTNAGAIREFFSQTGTTSHTLTEAEVTGSPIGVTIGYNGLFTPAPVEVSISCE